MNGKPFWKSKTLWVNVIGLAVALAAALGTSDAQIGLYAGGLLPIVNIVLRLVTGEPITLASSDFGIKE